MSVGYNFFHVKYALEQLKFTITQGISNSIKIILELNITLIVPRLVSFPVYSGAEQQISSKQTQRSSV